ncbi:MAG: aminoacyl-tRNA hydrolase [Phycisphaerae bacterium]|nr:aminoacyl-tRNA hydrolase [Phycisphaerae bacterium]
MKLIVGLGNPGSKYAGTRHNVGFRVIDELAARWGIDTRQEKFHAWFGKGVIREEPAVLLKPTTFMNRSGQAVLAAGRFYRLEVGDLVVVGDDLALPPGRLRLRAAGSAGSHRGLQDIISRVGTCEFARLRIGIGSAIGDAAGYVLSPFAASEEAIIQRVIPQAADAIECWITSGPEETMNRYNAMDPV